MNKEDLVFVVHFKDTETHRARTFTTLNDDNYIGLIKKYMNLVAKHMKIEELFLFYSVANVRVTLLALILYDACEISGMYGSVTHHR